MWWLYKLVLLLYSFCIACGADPIGKFKDGICSECRCYGNTIDCDKLLMSTEDLVSMILTSSPNTLKNITSLSFSTNALVRFPVENFPRMTEVRILDLSGNLLQRIPVYLYGVFPHLGTLDVSSNRISVKSGLFPYDKSVFKYFRYLKELRVKDNYIKYVRKINHLKDLTSLDMSNNMIERLSAGFFKSFTNNELSFSLDNNPIKELGVPLFRPFQTFRNLSFRGCHLSSFDEGVFTNITVRGLLALDDNRFTVLPSALTKMRANTSVSFHKNPVHCGCRAYGVFRVLEETGVSLVNGKCSSPSQLSGQNIDSELVDKSDLFCPLCISNSTPCKTNSSLISCSQCQCSISTISHIANGNTRLGLCRTNEESHVASCDNCSGFRDNQMIMTSAVSRITDLSYQNKNYNSRSGKPVNKLQKWAIFWILGGVILVILFFLVVTPIQPYCRRRPHKRHLTSIRERLVSSKTSRAQLHGNDGDVTMTDFDVTMDTVITGNAIIDEDENVNNDDNDNVFR